MTEPLPAEHAADVWQTHRPVLEQLSAELAQNDPALARSLEGAMQLRDAVLIELLGEHVAGTRYRNGSLHVLGQRIADEARAISGHGRDASQAGGR
jgi:hypothetical protein